jgi:hypothetical protein
VTPVPGHLGQEACLARPAEQVPDLGYRQQLGIAAGRGTQSSDSSNIAADLLFPGGAEGI